MKSIWITGAKGQLGIELQKKLARRKNVVATDAELDICDAAKVERFMADNNVGTIINCAAYTNVEAAEDNRDLCYRVNELGVKTLAEAAIKADAALVQISTDFVFDGSKGKPYKETDSPAPLSVYGASKLAGEQAMRKAGCRGVIIRTAWLYSPFGKNFMKTMAALGAERDQISVVCDQIGSPTAADSLAAAIVKILPKIGERRGSIYHFTGDGPCSWSVFAAAIMHAAGNRCRVLDIKSDEYPQKATRPKYSYLDCSKIAREFSIKTEPWQSSLERNMRRYKSL
jgi:dTDP-4-dehydrorhamnose reductase